MTTTYTDFSEKIISTLKTNNAEFTFFKHEPVFTKEDIEVLAKKFNFRGTEIKNMLICDKKSRNFYLIITLASKRMDFKNIAEIVGEKKVKMASPENVQKIAKAEPGCVSPFGFSDEISLFIDNALFTENYLLFSAGAPNNTIEINAKDLQKVLESVPNSTHFIDLP